MNELIEKRNGQVERIWMKGCCCATCDFVAGTITDTAAIQTNVATATNNCNNVNIKIFIYLYFI